MKLERVSLVAVSAALGSSLLLASCNLGDPLIDQAPSNNGTSGDTGNKENNGIVDDGGNNGTGDAGNGESVCGNGVLEPGEICDGDCPTCEDEDPCTENAMAGSPETCDVVCSADPITACVEGDSCCPEGCAFSDDADCECIPTTCEEEGRVCGVLENGCGQTLFCGECAQYESCLSGTCQASLGVGDSCPGGVGCAQTGGCFTEASTGWTGGYCSLGCPNGDADCPEGTHCDADLAACVLTCAEDSECNPGQECFDFSSSPSDPRQDGRTECLPVGSGADPIGAACESVSECGGGQGATCNRTWQDGYCSYQCSEDSQCPAGSHCSATAAGDGDCFKACTTDADCRGNGYACFDLTGDGRTECAALPVCPAGWTGPRCDQPDCSVPGIPRGNETPYCTAGFCKAPSGDCLRLADNPEYTRANSNSACIPAQCCDVPRVIGTCNADFCNDGNSCQHLPSNPQYARDPATTACIPAECGLDCDEPGGGCNPGFCFDGNNTCLWLTTYTELERGSAGECLPTACP